MLINDGFQRTVVFPAQAGILMQPTAPSKALRLSSMSTSWFPIKLRMTMPGACNIRSNVFLKKLIAQDNIFFSKATKKATIGCLYIFILLNV
jgi:hypothetical protein